jgi:hypothetical protein
MSSDYSNTGSLNPSKDKRSEKSPDWYGKLMVSGEVLEALKQGKQVRISGWNRDGRYGEFISLKVSIERETNGDSTPRQGYDWKAAEGRSQPTATENHQAALAEEFDDDIPF